VVQDRPFSTTYVEGRIVLKIVATEPLNADSGGFHWMMLVLAFCFH